jgi:multicomponent K+:H+ antiporter subunit F
LSTAASASSLGPLLPWVLPWCIAGFSLALLLNAWRLLRGPSVADRIMALDTLYINTLALLVVLGIAGVTKLYFEASLVIALLGFVGTVALSKFVLQGRGA